MRKTLVAATALLAVSLAFATAPSPLEAQSTPFAARLYVNERAITEYEYDQRLRFMRLLNAPGDLPKQAETTLIDDRLRMAEAAKLKIKLTPKQIEEGMAEFSGRFQMPVEQFLQIINANGVATETFRDFVHAGLVWRDVVRAKYGPTAQSAIYDAQVDTAMSDLMVKGSSRVLLSEIILPSAKRTQARDLSASLKGEGAFAAAARQYSVGETAAQGGQLDWKNLAALPQQAISAIARAGKGGVSAPVPTGDGRLAIYLVRSIDEREGLTPQTTGIDYAHLVMAAGPEASATLGKIQANVRACNDLNAYSGQLTRNNVAQSALPADLAGRIAGLDRNEVTFWTAGGNQHVLMLCQRGVLTSGETDRSAIRGRLVDAQVGGQAELYLQRLRANAHIRRP